MRLFEIADPAKYLYHVTFTEYVPNIKAKGLLQFQPSNWAKGEGGTRYNEEAGIFAFEHPEYAFKWAFKTQWEFKDKPVSIVRISPGDVWEEDSSQDIDLQMGKGRALMSRRNIPAASIIDSFSMEDFSNPATLGITQPEWFERINKMLSETKLQKADVGFGMTEYSNDNFVLAGGFRSGNSGPGTTRLKYIIYDRTLVKRPEDADQAEIGFVELFVSDDTGEIVGLVNIEIKPEFRKGGYGKRVVQDIKDTAGSLTIHDIQKKAKTFWDKQGVKYSGKSAKSGVLEDEDSGKLPPKVVKAFQAVGDMQRGEPEMAMLRVQSTMGGGVLSPVVEHVGDLTHRMTEHADVPYWLEDIIEEKVKRGLMYLTHRYGFEREMLENIRANKTDVEELDRRLLAYAKAHEKIPVYNAAQYHGREAAVALGYKDWDRSIKHLRVLKDMLDKGVYQRVAASYLLNGEELQVYRP